MELHAHERGVMDEWDVAIIGGGSAGLAAALTLARALRRTLLIDSGRPRNLAAPHSHGVLGADGTSAARLIERGRAEVEGFGARVLEDSVATVSGSNGAFELALRSGARAPARQVIVTSGVTDQLPQTPGLAGLWGTGVVICPYCDGWEARGRHIGILATGPKSVFQAQLLRQWTDRVTLFTDDIPVDELELPRLGARGIRLVAGRVDAMRRHGDGVALTVAGRDHEVDQVFTAPRALPNDDAVRELGAERSMSAAGSFLAVDARGATSVEGLWAAGNVVNPSLKIATAMGEGMATATHVNEALVEADIRAALGGR